ncbi:hypothetical protein ACFP1Z_30740 [Streptomyces gamaensis]|uniref:Uncharacterized protein n=1 Tax=Streptomyces gamaensis TaxID=1763542 RepID=A0ABW0ZD97_9ACTN
MLKEFFMKRVSSRRGNVLAAVLGGSAIASIAMTGIAQAAPAAPAAPAGSGSGAHVVSDQPHDAGGLKVLLEKHGLTGKSIAKDTFTGSIVARDVKTGAETVLVDSTKGAYQGSDFRYLGEQSTTGLLLFQDAVSGKVFKVDVRKGSVTEITSKRIPVTVKTPDGKYATYVVEKGKNGTTVKDNKGKPVHDLKQRKPRPSVGTQTDEARPSVGAKPSVGTQTEETKPGAEGGDLGSILDGIELPDFSDEANLVEFDKQRKQYEEQKAKEAKGTEGTKSGSDSGNETDPAGGKDSRIAAAADELAQLADTNRTAYLAWLDAGKKMRAMLLDSSCDLKCDIKGAQEAYVLAGAKLTDTRKPYYSKWYSFVELVGGEEKAGVAHSELREAMKRNGFAPFTGIG